ncbi:MAG: hypothetical protein K2K04_06985 [Clostridia bacterium]|nr:hypothetical protein [Clostridia bacterium]
MVRPNQKLYEELIEKGSLTIVDKSHKMYIFDGYKYLPINFDNMSVRDSINYLVCLYNIIGKVDASHQFEFESDPIVDHLFNMAYKTFKDAKNDILKWEEVSAAQKNISRAYIEPFLEKLNMRDDQNSEKFRAKISKSDEYLKNALNNNDFKLVDVENLPELAKQINKTAEIYAELYPTKK